MKRLENAFQSQKNLRKMGDKQIHIIAGPNGSGKSSHARVTLLPNFLSSNEFINADEIAKILSPEDPEKSAIAAGRLMLKRMEFLLNEDLGFAFETTLSAKTYLNFIIDAQARGYKVNLIFLKLESPSLARERVLTRVSKGGHNIELPIIQRRFKRGLENLKDYLDVVDTATVYESSGLELLEIAKKNENKLTIINQVLWEKIYA
jgi:predicted ABC-type ATPase